MNKKKEVVKKVTKSPFQLKSPFAPCGDQPQAIKEITHSFESGAREKVLLGVTGSGKTFTMANIIQNLGKKTLVLAHNKTLAAQLYAEFRDFFPENAVEYFVSYYDYYRPEAYLPTSDTFIEKDAAINDEIDKLRHSTTRSLLERDDVIVVASVSCIYGLGSPEEYEENKLTMFVGDRLDRDEFLKQVVSIQYERNDIDFSRGTFRVRGDTVEIFPAHESSEIIRIEFFGDEIEGIHLVDPLRGKILKSLPKMTLYPSSHYVVGEERLKIALKTIREELRERLNEFEQHNKILERERLKQRTLYDLEMIEEMGYCSGIENYSRHLTGKSAGEAPPTLLDFFKKDFLLIIDESHMTIPQIGGMYRGDRSRKMTLVDHGFRLPSALDNRPLNFNEFLTKLDQTLYVSATPGPYEMGRTGGEYVEQLIRPTGLVDPLVEVRSAEHQVDDLLIEVKKTIKKGERVLITTLTKKLAEELTHYYATIGLKIRYLHSDISTLERLEILHDLRTGTFDVLVGINLLREGLDLPEVSLVAILDADKEGFLRSTQSLIQTIGRAARNSEGRVILYAYKETESMKRAISETRRRRTVQEEYNRQNGITPQTVNKAITGGVMDVLQMTRKGDKSGKGKGKGERSLLAQGQMNGENIDKEIQRLKEKMKQAASELRFEDAAKIRDEIKELNEMRLML